MQIKLSLNKFLKMGGKVESITEAVNGYHNETVSSVSFSHITPASFGNPKGIQMYKVGTKTVAIDWIQVHVDVLLDPKHLGQ
jgi:hypothetical protein